MPSTPRCQRDAEVAAIHGGRLDELEAGVARSRTATRTQMVSAPVSDREEHAPPAGPARAGGCGTSATTTAPMAGSDDQAGEDREVGAVARGLGGEAAALIRTSLRERRRPATSTTAPSGDAQGVAAHVAGLQAAQAARRRPAPARPTPLTAPSMTCGRTRRWPRSASRPGPPTNAAIDSSKYQAVGEDRRLDRGRSTRLPQVDRRSRGAMPTRAPTMATTARPTFVPVATSRWTSLGSTTGSSQCSRNLQSLGERQVAATPPTTASTASTTSGSGHRPRRLVGVGSSPWSGRDGRGRSRPLDAGVGLVAVGRRSAVRRPRSWPSQRASPKKTMNTWRLM